MKTIALKVPPALLTKIELAARQRGETRSALMRHALEGFVADRGKGKAGSCLDLARDLRGCIKGPNDLSTSPKHMEGYGE